MRKITLLTIAFLSILAAHVSAQDMAPGADMMNQDMDNPAMDLSQYTYSYGTVLRASSTEVVLQEYDYDSDVEKEVSYQVAADLKIEGAKSAADLMKDDVVEIYYLEQDGKKSAKIIRKESASENDEEPEAAEESNT